jgi:hypothetical protein
MTCRIAINDRLGRWALAQATALATARRLTMLDTYIHAFFFLICRRGRTVLALVNDELIPIAWRAVAPGDQLRKSLSTSLAITVSVRTPRLLLLYPAVR